MSNGVNVPLSVILGNDSSWNLQAFLNGSPVNLNGSASPAPFTAKVVVKASQTATDGSGTTYTSGGADLTIASGSQGLMTLVLPRSLWSAVGTQWYRCDLIDVNSNEYTILFGQITVLAA